MRILPQLTLAWVIATALLVVIVALSPPAGAQDKPLVFKVDALNTGLDAPGFPVDRSTPATTLEGFLTAAADQDFARAAHFLDLGAYESRAQTFFGTELARKLHFIITRQVNFDWKDFPDRPDALTTTGSSSDPMVGVPRRSLRMAMLDLKDRPVALRLNRLQVGDAPPQWVFSRQTVAHVQDLYTLYKPGELEVVVPSWLGQEVVAGIALWEFIALPLLLIAAILLVLIVRAALKKAATAIDRRAPANALRAMRGPAAVGLAAGLLNYVTATQFNFSAPITAVMDPALLAMTVFAIALAFLRAIDAVLDIVTDRYVGEIDDEESADDRSLYTSIYALRRLVLLLAVLFGVSVVLMELRLFETVGVSLLASAGFVTVVLGIAGHAVLGNILASMQIAFAKPIRIGDSVNYEGNWAYVEAIFYTYIRLRTWDNRRMIVPVKYFVSKPFENWSMQESKMTRTFDLSLDHNALIARLREVFEKIAARDEDVLEDEMTKVIAVNHGPQGVKLRFYATAADPTRAWDMHARLREKMVTWVQENHPEWWPHDRYLSEEGLDLRGDTDAGAPQAAE